MTLQVRERVILATWLEGQVTILRIPDQHALALQLPTDPLADPLYQRLKIPDSVDLPA